MSYVQFDTGTSEYSVGIRDDEIETWEVCPFNDPGYNLFNCGGSGSYLDPRIEQPQIQNQNPSLTAPPPLPDTYLPANPFLPDPYHQHFNEVRQITSPQPYVSQTLDNSPYTATWEAYQNNISPSQAYQENQL